MNLLKNYLKWIFFKIEKIDWNWWRKWIEIDFKKNELNYFFNEWFVTWQVRSSSGIRRRSSPNLDGTSG